MVESTGMVFFAFVAALAVVCLGGLMVFGAEGSHDFYWLLPTWLVAMLAEFWFVVWLKRSLELGMRPFVPQFALRQPRWPLLLRPLVLVWWTVHLCFAGGTLMLIERMMLDAEASQLPLWTSIAVLVPVTWMLTHCSLLYLFLGVTSLHRDADLVDALWRNRIPIDVVLTAATLGVSQMF